MYQPDYKAVLRESFFPCIILSCPKHFISLCPMKFNITLFNDIAALIYVGHSIYKIINHFHDNPADFCSTCKISSLIYSALIHILRIYPLMCLYPIHNVSYNCHCCRIIIRRCIFSSETCTHSLLPQLIRNSFSDIVPDILVSS